MAVNGFLGLGRRPGRERRPRDTEGRMPLSEHIRELRTRLVRSMLAILAVSVLAFIVYRPILAFLVDPLCSNPGLLEKIQGVGNSEQCASGVLVQKGVIDPFAIALKISLMVGLIAAAPVWLYQLWAFIAPGLHANEKRYTVGFVATGFPLFVAGAALAYWVMPKAFSILLGFTVDEASNFIEMNDYLSFLIRLILVFGLAFELPLVLVLLNLGGVLSGKRMFGLWRFVIMGIFIFAAVATPTGDPLTMSLLAAPMTLLFFTAVAIALFNDRRRDRRRELVRYDDIS